MKVSLLSPINGISTVRFLARLYEFDQINMNRTGLAGNAPQIKTEQKS